MNGPDCPNCGLDTQIISTENEWNLYCSFCDIRFKRVHSNADGVFSMPAEDSGRSVIFLRRTAYVAFDKQWPEKEKPVVESIPDVDITARCLTDGSPVTPDHQDLLPNGQQKGYVVLTEEERRKGFVRPVRTSYVHIGKPPEGEKVNYPYTKVFPGGCGTRTRMSQAIAETYARCPDFYNGTFCCTCGTHFPLDQFVWDGTNERVGS